MNLKFLLLGLLFLLTIFHSYSQIPISNNIENPDCKCDIVNPDISALKTSVKFDIDSLYKYCEAYIISKIGKCVYCNYVYQPGKITITNFQPGKNMNIQFCFTLPQQFSNRKSIYQNKYTLFFNFKYYITANGEVVNPSHPNNIPNCIGTADCGFKIKESDALKIAQEKGFIKIANECVIDFNSTDWIIRKLTNAGEDNVYINMQTGVMSEIHHQQKID